MCGASRRRHYGNRLIASDLANPDFVRYAQSFGAEAERARSPQELRAALKRAFKRRDGPTLIEVPVGPMPSPWEFIHMPRVRGANECATWKPVPTPNQASARASR